MTLIEDFLDALNCLIRFTTPEGDYEGVLKRVFAPIKMIVISKTLFLPSNKKLGTLNFMFHEILTMKILNRFDALTENTENKNETSLICFRSAIEDVLNFDGDSDTECEQMVDEISNQEEFAMKVMSCFSKWISTESQIIDSFGDEFDLSIELISKQCVIGVTLEGPKIGRKGILTWLSISIPSCTYLFDILSLGKKSFQIGLKSIMESPRIQKIFHDCRMASDCLFHMYNVRLVNVFDTQVADSLVMMLESKNCSINKQVNSLDDCLAYFLEIPDEYLYGPLTFSIDKKSAHYHGLRPLLHSFRGAMIKNVIYLQLLKRELETALSTPLRRATDVYLNVIQSATDQELIVAPPVIEELPPELLLEGIQIVRYQQHEYIPPIISSGPPYRKLVNPVKDFVETCKKFQTGKERTHSFGNGDVISQNLQKNKLSSANLANQDFKSSRNLSFDSLGEQHSKCKIDAEISCKSKNLDTFFIKNNVNNFVLDKISVDKKTTSNRIPMASEAISLQIDASAETDETQGSMREAAYTFINHNASRTRLCGNDSNKIVTSSSFPKNGIKNLNPVGNFPKPFGRSASASVNFPECFSDNSTVFLDEETNQPMSDMDCEAFWKEVRRQCAPQRPESYLDDSRDRIRFIPAGMAHF